MPKQALGPIIYYCYAFQISIWRDVLTEISPEGEEVTRVQWRYAIDYTRHGEAKEVIDSFRDGGVLLGPVPAAEEPTYPEVLVALANAIAQLAEEIRQKKFDEAAYEYTLPPISVTATVG